MQMKMFLTRLGQGSRMVITGDRSQVDLPRGQPSGLIEAERILTGSAGSASTTSRPRTSCATRWSPR
jgi:phosphate starvation-inducible PhoH-like protein